MVLHGVTSRSGLLLALPAACIEGCRTSQSPLLALLLVLHQSSQRVQKDGCISSIHLGSVICKVQQDHMQVEGYTRSLSNQAGF